MRIVRFRKDACPAYGQLNDEMITPFAGTPWGSAASGEVVALADVDLLAPVEAPRVFAVGFNYAQHVAEGTRSIPEIPALFMKPSTTVIGPGQPIVYPGGSAAVHFEGELAVVIGRSGRRVPEADAYAHVFGYSCANDVSERTIQREEMKSGTLLIGKGFDTFCPIGPWVETELDLASAILTTRLNGDVRQTTSFADMIFSIPRVISWLSAAITLLPGDVILTGTPAGVGPIQPGDTVEVDISGLGTLRNPVVSEEHCQRPA